MGDGRVCSYINGSRKERGNNVGEKRGCIYRNVILLEVRGVGIS